MRRFPATLSSVLKATHCFLAIGIVFALAACTHEATEGRATDVAYLRVTRYEHGTSYQYGLSRDDVHHTIAASFHPASANRVGAYSAEGETVTSACGAQSQLPSRRELWGMAKPSSAASSHTWSHHRRKGLLEIATSHGTKSGEWEVLHLHDSGLPKTLTQVRCAPNDADCGKATSVSREWFWYSAEEAPHPELWNPDVECDELVGKRATIIAEFLASEKGRLSEWKAIVDEARGLPYFDPRAPDVTKTAAR